jgi:hypothetical protein
MAKGFWRAMSLGMGVAFAALIPGTAADAAQDATSKGPAGTAFAFFGRVDSDDVEAFLTEIRPAPPSAAHKDRVISELPTEGELRPSAEDLAKLASVKPILRLHQRQGAIEIKLIDVKHAFVGLHARTVLLISRDALDLMRAEDVQALAAHEIGHEYFWDEYSRAMTDNDGRRMQELELRCDGIAVLTLRQLALDPEDLVRAVTSLTRYNERLGAVASGDSYVSLSERVKFIRALQRLFDDQGDRLTGTAR